MGAQAGSNHPATYVDQNAHSHGKSHPKVVTETQSWIVREL